MQLAPLHLGPYLLLFPILPPLGGVAASAFFLPQQVSTAGCAALASLLGLMAANYTRTLGNQPLQLPPGYEWMVAGLGVYIALIGLAAGAHSRPLHEASPELFYLLLALKQPREYLNWPQASSQAVKRTIVSP